jgi:hypothetical protein
MKADVNSGEATLAILNTRLLEADAKERVNTKRVTPYLRFLKAGNAIFREIGQMANIVIRRCRMQNPLTAPIAASLLQMRYMMIVAAVLTTGAIVSASHASAESWSRIDAWRNFSSKLLSLRPSETGIRVPSFQIRTFPSWLMRNSG